mmetsp:Transcript_38683/g.87940  ORF Transcript_38683/g.87940 Transcript_38683/m.87940 type:complete len:128 (-) Transcript_38683:158-541(-)
MGLGGWHVAGEERIAPEVATAETAETWHLSSQSVHCDTTSPTKKSESLQPIPQEFAATPAGCRRVNRDVAPEFRPPTALLRPAPWSCLRVALAVGLNEVRMKPGGAGGAAPHTTLEQLPWRRWAWPS